MRTTSISDPQLPYFGAAHDDRRLLWTIGLVLAGIVLSIAFLAIRTDRSSGVETAAPVASAPQ